MSVQVPRWLHVGYAQNAKGTVLLPAGGQQLNLLSASVTNRSGGAIDMGLLRQMSNPSWVVGLWTDSTTTFTDETAAIQAGTASALTTTTNNDGYIVGCKETFGLVGITVSTGATGGSPVYTYQYWNGVSWGTLTTIAVPTYGAGTSLVVFPAPFDWALGGSGTGVDQARYNVRMRATTAPSSTAVAATALWVGQFLRFFPGVADKTRVDWAVTDIQIPLTFNAKEGLLPYFSGSANAANLVEAQYIVQY